MQRNANNQHPQTEREVNLDEKDLEVAKILASSKIRKQTDILVKRSIDTRAILDDKINEQEEAERKNKILKMCRKRHELSFLQQSVAANDKLKKLKKVNNKAKTLLEAINSPHKRK